MKRIHIKILLLQLLFMTSTLVFSQNREEQVNSKVLPLIKVQKKTLKERRITETVCMFDDSGHLFIFWKEGNKVRYTTADYNNKGVKKSIRNLNHNSLLIRKIIEDPSLVQSMNNSDCFEMAHAFSKVTVVVETESETIKNHFFTHCKQQGKCKDIKVLYFDLIR